LRYLVLAVLMLVAGVVVVTLDAGQRSYVPVVRLRTSDGFFMTMVQASTATETLCMKAVERFVAPLKRGCAGCSVESIECTHKLSGIERALADGTDVPLYRISAPGVNMALVGPPTLVRARCEHIAESMVGQGLQSAACVFPRSASPAARDAAVTER
jgi:hypothetical protein